MKVLRKILDECSKMLNKGKEIVFTALIEFLDVLLVIDHQNISRNYDVSKKELRIDTI